MQKINKQNYNSLLLESLGTKPIAFNPILATLANSALAGLLLSQLLYWRGKGRFAEWTYKTIKEMHAETAMTRSEQDRAIKIWKKLGILEVDHRGIPQKRFFKINHKKLIQLLESKHKKELLLRNRTNPFAESSKLDCAFELTTTESTSETTSIDPSLQDAAKLKSNKKEDSGDDG